MSLAQRQAFTTIKNAYAKKGRSPVTTPSTLRLMSNISTSRTTYSFPILEGDSNITLAEQILLNRADSFTATSVGVFIGGLNDGGTAVVSDGNYQLFNYQSVALTTAGITDSRKLFEQSYLNVSVNNVAYLQNFDLLRCYNAPIVQTGSLLATGTSTGIQSSVNGLQGFASLVPTLQFSGTSKISIEIQLPSSLSKTIVGDVQINLIFRGFLSLGASNLNK
jgi:hypothetical protein